jgi:hypothetical protein
MSSVIVVIADVAFRKAFQMALIEHDHMVPPEQPQPAMTNNLVSLPSFEPSLGEVREKSKDGLNYVWIPPGTLLAIPAIIWRWDFQQALKCVRSPLS